MPGVTPAESRAKVSGRTGLAIALAAICLVPLLAYPSLILRGWEPVAPDTGASRPYGIWGQELEQQTGAVPVWYPYIFSGMPSYGSFTYTPRSPVNPMALFQKLIHGRRGVYYYFLFVLAGVGGFAFLRRQGASRLAAAAAALLYSMTPYFPGAIAAGHSTKIEALCLLPAWLLAIDLFLDRPNAVRSALLAFMGALLAWSNHPQVAFYALFIGLLFALGRLLLEKDRRWGRSEWLHFGGFLLLAVVLASAMAAEPYLAVREYAPYSIRGGTGETGVPGSAGTGGVGWDYATAWSFHPKEMVSFLFPSWFGLEGETYWGPMPFTQSTHYFGILALALSLLGLSRMRGKRRWTWGLISGVVLLVGFGKFLPLLYGPMFYLIPLFAKFRIPSMIYSTLPLCLAPLVAGGLDSIPGLLTGPSPAPRAAREGKGAAAKSKGASSLASPAVRRILYLLAGVAVLWLLLSLGARAALSTGNSLIRPEELGRADAGTLQAVQAERLSLLVNSVSRGCLFLLGALIVLLLGLLGRSSQRPLSPWVGVALSVLALGDVLEMGHRFHHVVPPAANPNAVPLAGAAHYLSTLPGPFRIFPAEGEIFQSNAFGLDHLESIGGYHPAKLRAYQDILGANLIAHPGVLQMLNVRYFLSSSRINLGVEPIFSADGYVYPYPDSLPRAWAVQSAESVADRAGMLRRLGEDDFHPGNTALLYASAPHPAATTFARAVVTVEEHASGLLRLRVEAEGRALVVCSEMAYPPGWKATVNGAPTSIYRVDHVLQGIEVPAGKSDVVLRVFSPGLTRGRRVSRSAAAATLLLALLGLVPGRRKATPA